MTVEPTEEQERARDAFTVGGDLAVVAEIGELRCDALRTIAATGERCWP